jgi:hypothetical protein
MMAKRKAKHLPTYDYPRASYRGIAERLALVSNVFKVNTWQPRGGLYMHTIRLFGKKEGWECRMTWADNCKHVSLKGNNASTPFAAIAIAIEGARNAWYDNQHPGKELLAIVAREAAKKAA